MLVITHKCERYGSTGLSRTAENAELKPFFCSSLRPLRLCDKMWVITNYNGVDWGSRPPTLEGR